MTDRVALLGGLRIERGSERLTSLAGQPLRCALLVTVAAERETTREAVMGRLWPDRDPRKARHVLSQTLYELRRDLGDDWIQTEGDALRIGAGVDIDVHAFEDDVAHARFEQALGRYDGEFLHGVYLADTNQFEMWVDGVRSRLRRAHRKARREALSERRACGDLAGALAVARRWAELEPFDDEAQYQCIELLALAGSRTEALRQFEHYRKSLSSDDDELEPLDDLVQLVARIRNGDGVETRSTAAAPDAAVQSATDAIAVMPFLDLSAESHEYIGDGMAEELISTLARARMFRVAARTSSFNFKNSQLDAREIGRRLGVGRLIEGSVRVAEGRLRLAVQLIDVQDGCAVWSETFERDLRDVLAVQREVAIAIARRMGITVDRAAERVGNAEPRHPEAYRTYLEGRFFWNRRTPTDLQRAIEHFEHAIALDPSFAMAYAGLADAYSILLDYGLIAPEDGLPPAREAALHALDLDPSLGEPHTSIALTQCFEWHWHEAAASFRTAIDRCPEYAVAHQRFALFLAWTGNLDLALREIHRAQELDPLSPVIDATVGWLLYYAREYARAEERLLHALELAPHLPTARAALGLVALQRGDTARAIAEHEQALHDSGDSAPMRALLAHSRARAGHLAEARRDIRALEREAQQRYVSPYYLALPALGLGDPETALDRLEQAVRARAPQIVYLDSDPVLDPVRATPRFERMLHDAGLPATVAL